MVIFTMINKINIDIYTESQLYIPYIEINVVMEIKYRFLVVTETM